MAAAPRDVRPPGRELSDPRLLSQSRLVALFSTVPLALTGGLSLYVATQGGGRSDTLPWLVALGSALLVLGVRAQQRHEGRVFVAAEGLYVRTLFGTTVHVAWRELEGARVGVTPWGLPARHAGALRLRLRSGHPLVGRWVTTLLPTREAALAAASELAGHVRRALEGDAGSNPHIHADSPRDEAETSSA